MLRQALRLGAEVLFFFLIAAGVQWMGGVFSVEFGGYPDEPSHVVTSLMVRDYVASSPLRDPLQFAQNYYLHYPRVAFGHWPPLFYLLQAAWMLLLPVTRTSTLLFMAAWAAVLATGLRRAIVLAMPADVPASWCVALMFLGLPLVAEYTGLVMLEIPAAALMFAAVIFFGRYLDSARTGEMMAFGVFTCLALLTKANAWALGPMAAGAVIFSGEYRRLRSPWFWIPGLIAVALCIPWFGWTLPLARQGWGPQPGWAERTASLAVNTGHLLAAAGAVVVLCALLGIWDRIIAPVLARKRIGGVWAACLACVLSVLLVHSFLFSTSENRHLTAALPPVMMFAAAGMSLVARFIVDRRRAGRSAGIAVAAAVTACFFATTFRVVKKPDYRMGPAVATILDDPETRNAAVLISSHAEGPFIAEIALHERRPGHFILRASKVLSHCRWDGSGYHALFTAPHEVLEYLDQVPVGVVAIDRAQDPYSPPDRRLLLQTLTENPAVWEPMPERAGNSPIVLFRRKGLNALTGRIHLTFQDLGVTTFQGP